MRRSAALLFALALLAPPAAPAAAEPPSPLAAFAPFIGDWGPDPASDRVKERPARAGDVAFRFAWADPARRLLRFYEGIPGGDLERRLLETLVAADPRSGAIVFLGYQLQGRFLYRGTFEVQESGFVRLYEVTYPPEQQFRDERDRERGKIDYRDSCRLLEPDLLECRTERLRGGEWEPWGSGEPYRLVRRSAPSAP